MKQVKYTLLAKPRHQIPLTWLGRTAKTLPHTVFTFKAYPRGRQLPTFYVLQEDPSGAYECLYKVPASSLRSLETILGRDALHEVIRGPFLIRPGLSVFPTYSRMTWSDTEWDHSEKYGFAIRTRQTRNSLDPLRLLYVDGGYLNLGKAECLRCFLQSLVNMQRSISLNYQTLKL